MTTPAAAPPARDPSDGFAGAPVLVVGGYGGIGSAICTDLADHGATVVVAGRDRVRSVEHAAEVGKDALGVGLDICDGASIEQALSEVEQRLGLVELVVNCASTLRVHPAETFPESDYRDVVEANLVGPFLLSRAVARRLLAADRPGRITHLSSVRGSAGAPGGFSAYGPAKAGLDLLVRQLATEWGPRGIAVNAVAPGFVPTDLVAAAGVGVGVVERMQQRIPLRRFADPADIAGAVRYLLGPTAAFVTGQILYVDGGVSASQ